MQKSKKKLIEPASFITGLAAGSLLTFLYATHGGKVIRTILKNDSNLIIDNAVEKKNELIKKLKSLISNAGESINSAFKNSRRTIDVELMSIRAGISSAVDTYLKTRKVDKNLEDITEDYLFEDDYDLLPKYEGMKKRVSK